MTLSKQLIITISVVFAILFVGTLALSINNMRAYLTQQLESHAQDTASSLGLSLSPHFKTNDIPLMRTMVSAIFDRGYYREINIIAIDGSEIVKRSNKVKVENVPAWFVNAITLKTPQASSIISNGWKQAAKVYVSSNPGYAYLELWNNTVETFVWFMLSFSLAIAGFIVVLRYILLPLKLIEKQAISISLREFPILNVIPKTRELKRVVDAMNKMSGKVKTMLTEQTDLIERTQKEAYLDKLTETANRRSFDMQLEHTISAVNDIKQAALLFVRIKGLIEINNEKGYQEGDDCIKYVADVIKQCLKEYPKAFVARTSGEQFAILLPGILLENCNEIADNIAYQIPLGNTPHAKTDLCHIGGAWYSGATSKEELLAKADLALQTSLNETPNSSRILEMGEGDSNANYGSQKWANALREGIKKHRFKFYQQPVTALKTETVLHHEIFTKLLTEEGEIISAANYIPMAEKMGLMPELDRNIVDSFINQLKNKTTEKSEYYSLNISPSSFHDEEFIQWLYQKLKSEPEIARQIILETSEYVASSHVELFKKIVSDFQPLGCRFSLDHFGTAFTPFGYLHNLKLDYIKIHGGLVKGVSTNKDNRFFIQTLCQIAHGLEIQVIGEFVENEEDYIALKQLGLDAVQGFYMGKVTEY